MFNKKVFRNFSIDSNLTMGRLFHGRGGTWPDWDFVSLDYYAPYLLVQIFRKKEKCNFEQIDWLISQVDNTFQNIILHWRKDREFEVIKGSIPSKNFVLKEGAFKYEVSLGQGQNTGVFLDASPLRKYIFENSRNKTVLNLFSYTCTLSVSALKGGASKVVNVDMKSSFLEWGKRNHLLNDLKLNKAIFLKGKVQKMIKKMGGHGPYDLVIVDPPSIQKDSFDLDREYPKLISKLMNLAPQGAIFILCCNSPFIRFRHFQDMIANASTLLEFKEQIHLDQSLYETDQGTKFLVYSKNE